MNLIYFGAIKKQESSDATAARLVKIQLYP